MVNKTLKKTQVWSLNICFGDMFHTIPISVFSHDLIFFSMCVGNSDVYFLFHYITCKSILTNKQVVYVSVTLLCVLIKIAFLAQRMGSGVVGMVNTWVLGEKLLFCISYNN
jgi:hypothetical protein